VRLTALSLSLSLSLFIYILFGEIEGGAGGNAILARFLRTTQKATQTNCSLCRAQAILGNARCGTVARSYVARYRAFLCFLLPSARPRAGHRVDGRGPREGTTRRGGGSGRRGRAGGAGGAESEVIFMPVFYCALARESRMETICHPVGKASW
jgi:hypothetical protein